jgi:hypothetical protein
MAQSIEQAFAAAVASLRARLASADIPRFCFRLEAEGRTDGDIKLSIQIGEYGTEVTGRDMEGVVQEWLRRKGWTQANDPLELPDYTARTDL